MLGALVAYAFAGSTLANPVAPAVVNGAANFATAGKSLTVTNTPNAIINWQAFSIGAGETTRFIQQSASSAVLNRVVGQDPSSILGTLSSNGRVFLLNPNGIVFGAGSRVDVAGLVASTLNLSNQDFLAGRLNFEAGATSGSIVNHGSIVTPVGGRVYLIAPNIENHGVISTPQGQTILAAGRTVQLVEADVPDLRVEIQAGGEALNVGQLLADGGSAGIYAGLIAQKGTVRADSVSRDAAGNIVFRASGRTTLEAGSVTSASGGTGGRIEITGSEVGLIGNARVEAKGEKGGGMVLVGGDYQGKNPEVPNARATYVGPDATIDASATDAGDGGKVIVWSDEATRVYGSISARGGAQGGDGGFVETSGKYLDVAGIRVNASAPSGRGGLWLLDPNNITIQTSGSDTAITGSPNFTTATDGAIILSGTIEGQLNAGTSVSVMTGIGSPASELGNINVNGTITKSGGANATLTLSAHNGINVNSSITSSAGQLNLILIPDSDSSGGGAINLGAMTLDANGGAITATGKTANLSGGIATINSSFSVGNLNVGGGALTGTGGLSVSNAYSSTGGSINLGGAVSITQATGDLVVNNAITGNGVSLAATAGSVTGTNSVILGGVGGLTLSAGGATGDVLLTNGLASSLALTSVSGRDLKVLSSGAAATLQGASMNVNMTRDVIVSGGTSGGAVVQSTGGAQTIAAGGAVTLTAGSAGTFNDAIVRATGGLQTVTATGALTLTGGAGGDDQFASMQSNAGQLISAASIYLTGGSNGAGTAGNVAELWQSGAGSAQTINVNSGSALVLQGGTGNRNQARIQNDGATQTINMFNGGSLSLTGGSGGYDNVALIETQSGSQMIQGSAGTANAPAIVLQGGGNGGTSNLGNAAVIAGKAATQNIYAASLILTAGAGIESDAVIGGGATQTLTVSGVTQIAAGSGADAVAGIGNNMGGNITLSSTGGVSLQGGTGAGTFAFIGTAGSSTGNISITGAGNSISLAKGASGGMGEAFIGSFGGTGVVQLNASAINLNDGVVKTMGSLILTSGSPMTIGAGGFVAAGSVTANASLAVQGWLALGSGTTNLGFGGTHTGTFEIGPGATLNFSGGVHTLNPGASIMGAGAIGLTAGSLNVNTPVSVPTFNMSGGTMAGSSPFTVDNAWNYTGGSVNGQLVLGPSSISFLDSVNVATSAGTPRITNFGVLGMNASTIAPPLANDGALVVLGGVNALASINNNGLVLVGSGTLNAPLYSQSGGLTLILPGAVLGAAGGFSQTGGSTVVDGELRTSGAGFALLGGSLGGNGTVSGNVNNISGTLAAGALMGALTIDGNYTQGPSGTMQVEIAGSSPGEYGFVKVTGSATLDGTLELIVLPGAIVVTDAPMQFLTAGSISGTFAAIAQPPLGFFEAAYTPTAIDLAGWIISLPPDVPPPPAQVLPNPPPPDPMLADAPLADAPLADEPPASEPQGSTAQKDAAPAERRRRVPTCG
jgi:filamentous hemagglutinin family protein